MAARHVTVHLAVTCIVQGGADKLAIGDAVRSRPGADYARTTDGTTVLPMDYELRAVEEKHDVGVRTPVEATP